MKGKSDMEKIIKDFLSEKFTKKELVKYGLIEPAILLIVLILISALE